MKQIQYFLIALTISVSVGCASIPAEIENHQGLTLSDFLQQGEIGRTANVNGHTITLLHNAKHNGTWYRQYSDDGEVKIARKQGDTWVLAHDVR